MAAAESARVRRGFLQYLLREAYELEHKRLGPNVWERVWCEAMRGDLALWRGIDVVQSGITPMTEPLRRLKLDAAKVGPTKSPRKEEAHSFRITLSLAAVASGGAVGEAKHVLAASSAEGLEEWMGTLQANVDLCALPPDERAALMAQDERAADADDLQERLTIIAQLCVGLCATVCSLAGACCGSCAEQTDSATTGSRRKYHAVTPTGAKGSDGTDEEDRSDGAATEVFPAVYICRKKQSIRETGRQSSRIVGWVEEGVQVEVFEEELASVGPYHRRLRLAEGWVNAGSGPILDGDKPTFVYFEKETPSSVVLSSLKRRP